jgi:hypothetical protein
VEREFVVDGATFLVRFGEDGRYDCVWLTGPNPGYGFGSGAPAAFCMPDGHSPTPVALPAGPASDERVTDGIRDFLSAIDPKTGFIGG